MNAAPDPRTVSVIQSALSLARSGDLRGARRAAEVGLTLGSDLGLIRGLLGMLCCQAGDLAAGVTHLRAAYVLAPADLGVISNLTTALIDSGDAESALPICTAEAAARDPSARIWRLRGYLLQVAEDYAGAAHAYEQVVAAVADDFESWNNLGNARAGSGDIAGSIQAIERAVSLRPDVAPLRINLATTLMEADQLEKAQTVLEKAARDFSRDEKPHVELAGLHKLAGREAEAMLALQNAVSRAPADADLQIKLGMEYLGTWAMDDAQGAFRRAVELDPDHADAHILLALLLEHTNDVPALTALLQTLEGGSVDSGAVSFIRALVCRREKRFADGLEAIAQVPDDIEPPRSAQLRGQFQDRLGDSEAAYAAFEAMNELHKDDVSDPLGRATEYRQIFAKEQILVTPEWYGSWSPVAPEEQRASPVFLVGFPRSGTTLLDTLLMGHPDVQVMEERPPLAVVEEALGGWDKLASLNLDEIGAIRDQYFNEAANWLDLRPGATLVDKSPLHMNRLPMIHRLFPHAKIILALRHPCDVVLSCYITNFRLNNAMANFIDLATAAQFYTLSFGFWEHCTKILPVSVHELRYEAMVADKEAALRPLFDYLGLDWRDEVLDHRQTAARRGVISTASYAQVTEPIYDRAAGRWTRYREQLDPILPVLAPWVERYGYEL